MVVLMLAIEFLPLSCMYSIHQHLYLTEASPTHSLIHSHTYLIGRRFHHECCVHGLCLLRWQGSGLGGRTITRLQHLQQTKNIQCCDGITAIKQTPHAASYLQSNMHLMLHAHNRHTLEQCGAACVNIIHACAKNICHRQDAACHVQNWPQQTAHVHDWYASAWTMSIIGTIASNIPVHSGVLCQTLQQVHWAMWPSGVQLGHP